MADERVAARRVLNSGDLRYADRSTYGKVHSYLLAIRFIDAANCAGPNETGAGPGWGRGRITIDELMEDFESRLWFWKTADYERQWAQEIQRMPRAHQGGYWHHYRGCNSSPCGY
jgi:hypothetical protein